MFNPRKIVNKRGIENLKYIFSDQLKRYENENGNTGGIANRDRIKS